MLAYPEVWLSRLWVGREGLAAPCMQRVAELTGRPAKKRLATPGNYAGISDGSPVRWCRRVSYGSQTSARSGGDVSAIDRHDLVSNNETWYVGRSSVRNVYRAATRRVVDPWPRAR